MARVNSAISRRSKNGSYTAKRSAMVTAGDRRKVAGVSIGKRPGRRGETAIQMQLSIQKAVAKAGLELMSE
jgi:hypothetical protein